MRGKKYEGKEKVIGKTVIVTGANTGIGKETAKELAKRGARVILAGRNNEKCELARDEIIKETANRNVEARHLDLASLQSIKEFAEEICRTERHVDILINNAGVMRCPKSLTTDGFEMQLGVNHLGHFYLTNLLLPKLKDSAPSRIITLSSLAHRRGEMNFSDLNSSSSYSPGGAYSQSKIANILFTVELAKRLEGTGVTALAVNPGIVDTELMRHLSIYKSTFSRIILAPLRWIFLKTPNEGAQTSLYAALSKDLDGVSGKYLSNCAIEEASKEARDEKAAERLWLISEKWTRLK
ncbi:retinol dehydrogenase 13-like isoform X2 [Tubulanus polymorphus]